MRMLLRLISWFSLLVVIYGVHAIDISSSSSKQEICDATALIQKGMLDYYEGERYGGTVGMFQPPYYWWNAGEAFGGMLQNWYLCQNDTFENLLMDAFLAQAGKDYDFIPDNQTMVEGNDDQGVWGMTIMDAVERNFTAPNDGKSPGWLYMAQAVYNTMWSRWDAADCGGGLRWQIFTWNSGYNYKSTIANACLFNIAARLGRYTGNDTYIKVAETVFDWLETVGFLVESNGMLNVYDGADIDVNCTDITTLEWSYTHGILLGGSAYMYNATNASSIWEDRVSKLIISAKYYFFENDIMYESACQNSNNCNNDQRSFKSIFSRMLSLTTKVAPFTKDTLTPLLYTSAKAAGQSCSGGSDGHTCGLNWQKNGWDGMYGLGEQMSALEVINSLLFDERPAPYTQYNGGSSVGDVNAGLNATTRNVLENDLNISSGDRAGAAIVTAIILSILLGGSIWMLF